jgi:hypothetical protein
MEDRPWRLIVSERSISDVLQRHTAELMALPNVVGTAQGELNGEPSVMVMVVARTEELESMIPKEIDGFLIVISETGELNAQ